MAITSTNQAGERYILEDGAYRRIDDREREILDQSTLSVAKDSAVSLLKGVGKILQAGQIRGDSSSLIDEALGEFQTFGELTELRPGASNIGTGALEIGTGLLASAIKKGGTRLATQSARRAGRAAPQPTVKAANDETLVEVADLVNTFGADTAGAAARGGFMANLMRMPRFKASMEHLQQFIGGHRPLTGQQQRFLAPGVDGGQSEVERVGLALLPGQDTGNGIIAEVVLRDPLMRDSLDHILSANSDSLLTKMTRALGLDPGDYGRDIRQLGRDKVGERFQTVAAGINDFDIPEELATQIDELLTVGERATINVAEESIGGSDAMDIRRLISEELAGARTDPALTRKTRELDQLLESFDDLLESNMDEGLMQEWSHARSQWRVVRALDRRGVVQQDGSISVKTLVNALEREFPFEFNRTALTQGNLPGEITEFMDFARVSRTFMSNLNDSGTATGNSVMQAIMNPIQFGKKRLASKFITDVILNRPDLADALPNQNVADIVLP